MKSTHSQTTNTSPWHLTFSQQNVDENLSNTLLSISNQEERVLRTFNLAKEQFATIDQTNCLIELRNSQREVVDECFVTYQQMANLAELLGFELKGETPPLLRLIK